MKKNFHLFFTSLSFKLFNGKFFLQNLTSLRQQAEGNVNANVNLNGPDGTTLSLTLTLTDFLALYFTLLFCCSRTLAPLFHYRKITEKTEKNRNCSPSATLTLTLTIIVALFHYGNLAR